MDDAYHTWEVGKKLSLTTHRDAEAIQAFLEEKAESKSAKRKRRSKRKMHMRGSKRVLSGECNLVK